MGCNYWVVGPTRVPPGCLGSGSPTHTRPKPGMGTKPGRVTRTRDLGYLELRVLEELPTCNSFGYRVQADGSTTKSRHRVLVEHHLRRFDEGAFPRLVEHPTPGFSAAIAHKHGDEAQKASVSPPRLENAFCRHPHWPLDKTKHFYSHFLWLSLARPTVPIVTESSSECARTASGVGTSHRPASRSAPAAVLRADPHSAPITTLPVHQRTAPELRTLCAIRTDHASDKNCALYYVYLYTCCG